MSRNRLISLASEVFVRIPHLYRLFLEKLIRRNGDGHFPRLWRDEIRQCEDRAVDDACDDGDGRQEAEQAGHRSEAVRDGINHQIIQHVRSTVARGSGNGIGEGSIGDEKAAKPFPLSQEMPENTSPASASTSPEAEILSALGSRLIVLVGMMGAGKSTIGRRLAARLRLPFLDADAEIETAHAMPIPEIFERFGEPYFRDGEARVIARLLESGPAVLATGGGSFMREETRRRVHDKAVSIWLKADADIIMRRVKRRTDRPLLQTTDPAATVGRLIAEREPIYQDADITISSRDVPHDKIVEECIEALRGRLRAQPAPDSVGAAP